MKLSYSTAFAVLAFSAAVNGAPAAGATSETSLEVRQEAPDFQELIARLDAINVKRDDMTEAEIAKRDYKIVTDVLAAINQTNLAPQILHYFATSPVFQPIVIKTIVAVLESNAINLTSLFQALDQSNLIGQVLQQLISDCSLYVSLFNTAKQIIGNLAQEVKSAISGGKAKRQLLADQFQTRDLSAENFVDSIDKRDINVDNQIVVNLLDSLAKSGLATSVVKSIITDPSYIPFATNLIESVLKSNALPTSELISALKNSSLVPDLLKQILSVQTFQTVAVNAFAAFAGKCSNSSGGTSTPSSGSGGSTPSSGGSTSGGSSGGSNPCKRRRKRSNY